MLGLQEDKQNHNHHLGALGKAVAKHEEFPALSEATLILKRQTQSKDGLGHRQGWKKAARQDFTHIQRSAVRVFLGLIYANNLFWGNN